MENTLKDINILKFNKGWIFFVPVTHLTSLDNYLNMTDQLAQLTDQKTLTVNINDYFIYDDSRVFGNLSITVIRQLESPFQLTIK